MRPALKLSTPMIRGLLAFVAAAFFCATSVRAQDPSATAPASTAAGAPGGWRGFYLGGGVAYSNVSVLVGQTDCYYDCYWGDYDDYDDGDGDFGYTLHAGWRFHKYGALEVSYLDAGPIGWDQDLVYMPEFDDYYNNRIEYSASITEVTLLGVLPFGDTFEVYAKLGAAFSEGESVQRLDQSFGDQVIVRSVSDNGTDVVWGLGVGMTFAKVFHVRLGFESIGVDEDVLNTRSDTTLDSFVLEGQFRFGGY
jgi:Outer membrane protein beta-barrel domain